MEITLSEAQSRPATKKRPGMANISMLAKSAALTVPAAKKVLMAAGYMDERGKPTQKARDEDVIEIRETEDRYGDRGTVEMVMWDKASVGHLFAEPSELQKRSAIKNRFDLENKFEDLFVDAGSILGIINSEGERTMGIRWALRLSDEARNAVQECFFSDPHFIGGPGALSGATYVEDVEYAFDRADKVAQELAEAIRRVDKEFASMMLELMSVYRQWLLRRVRK